jgi:hypothetical protein
MTATPAPNFEPEVTDPAPPTAQMIRFPGVAMDPIDAEPTDYVPPPDAVLNQEPPAAKPKRQRKPGRPKGSRNKKDIEAAAKRRAEESAARAPAADATPAPTTATQAGVALHLATPPHGDALPNIRFSRSRVDTLLAIVGAFCLLAFGFGAGYFMTGLGQ